MIELNELLKMAMERKASDVHITVGRAPLFRIYGELTEIGSEKLTVEDTLSYAKACLGDEKYELFCKIGEADCSIAIAKLSRFRVNAFKQRGSAALAIRVLASEIPSLDDLKLPTAVKSLCSYREGLILVTGPAGSGKSTTVAAIINEINAIKPAHIITLEDPVEYLHKHKKSTINQREIGQDSQSYNVAIKAALREDPDIIFIGELRDIESISMAITAAETGHLVISTLHTLGAAKTVDRLIDVFPPHQQQQIRIQVSMVLRAVLSQRLIPCVNGRGRVVASELMVTTPVISNFIREGKTANINMAIQTDGEYGMHLLERSIANLYKNQLISRLDALDYSADREIMQKLIGLI